MHTGMYGALTRGRGRRRAAEGHWQSHTLLTAPRGQDHIHHSRSPSTVASQSWPGARSITRVQHMITEQMDVEQDRSEGGQLMEAEAGRPGSGSFTGSQGHEEPHGASAAGPVEKSHIWMNIWV